MTLFKQLLNNHNPTCYVLAFPPAKAIKLGYTDKGTEKRLHTIKFSGNYVGMEDEVEIVAEYPTSIAKDVEYYANKIASLKYPKPMDKNLGSGYTEWFYCTAHEMRSCILLAFRFIKWSKDKIGNEEEKEFKDLDKPKQVELDF